MNIMKMFRKYNKHLMVVLVVGLMIVFLIPQAVRQLGKPNPLKRVIGRAFGEAIYLRDRRTATRSIEMLNDLHYAMAVRNQQRTDLFDVRSLLGPPQQRNVVLDYLLVVREAKRMGLELSSEQVDRQLRLWTVPADVINFVIKRHHMSLKSFRKVVADYIRVRRAFVLSVGSVAPSEPELRSLFTQINEKITAAIIPVPANDLAADIAAPTDEDVAGYFDKNKEKFRFPDRVAVEYLAVDIGKVKSTIKIKRKKVREHWEQHKDEFTETTTRPATTSAQSQPATQEVTRTLTFEQAQPKVLERLKIKAARDKAAGAISAARERARACWVRAKIDKKTGQQTYPDQLADYQALASEITSQTNVPVRYYRSGLVDRSGAAKLEGIGRSLIGGREPLPFADYAFRVVPLVTPSGKGQDAGRFILFKDQDSGMLWSGLPQRPEGCYMFRVVRVEPSHLPNSLAEVTAKVADDLRHARAYKKAQVLAGEIKALASGRKLTELADSDKKVKEMLTKLTVKQPVVETFARRIPGWTGRLTGPAIQAVTMPTAAFADRCFQALWPSPTTHPDATFACTLIDDSANRTVYVVQMLGKTPVMEKDYEKARPRLLSFVMQVQAVESHNLWFDPENIYRRTNWQQGTK